MGGEAHTRERWGGREDGMDREARGEEGRGDGEFGKGGGGGDHLMDSRDRIDQ